MSPFGHIQYSFSMCDYVILTLDQMVKVLLASTAHCHHYFWSEAVELLEHIRREIYTSPRPHLLCISILSGLNQYTGIVYCCCLFAALKQSIDAVQSSNEVVIIRNQELHYR